MAQNTSTAVMQRRVEPHNSLDDYPTPPWGTRALLEHLNASLGDSSGETCWEPACNRGHMAKPLREAFKSVHATDVIDYGWAGQDGICDFLMPGTKPPAIEKNGVDWIVTNPPFRLAEQFAKRAFDIADSGVALFTRLAFLESVGRLKNLFFPTPPEWILQFSERIVLHKGRLSPDGSTATAYCWLVWLKPYNLPATTTRFVWIPPCRKRLERPGDYEARQ